MRADLLDTSVNDCTEDKDPLLYHIIRTKQRREQREINQVIDHMDILHTTLHEIKRMYVQHFTRLFAIRWVEEVSIHAILRTSQQLPQRVDIDLWWEMTPEEIKVALSVGGKNWAPGPDGICWEFYVQYWGIIYPELCEVLNQMFGQGMVIPKQTDGEMVCSPKCNGARRMEAFRPITLLNTDYKLLARIMAARLRSRVAEPLQTTQYCGVPGNMILDTVLMIRDVIAYAENTIMCAKPRFCTGLWPDLSWISLSYPAGIWDWLVVHRTRQRTILHSHIISTVTRIECGMDSGQERHTARMSLEIDLVCTMHPTAPQQHGSMPGQCQRGTARRR
jgi:hypothetical protein